MKHLFIFLITGYSLLACTSSDKQGTGSLNQDSLNQVSLSDSANFTAIEWIDSVEQDLGKVNQGQMLEISWKFKNAGNSPLVIANVRPGCGCTGAEGPKTPIAPGKEGVITAKFDTEHYPGTQRKEVYVKSNTKTTTGAPEETLVFKVNVEPKQ